MRWLYRAILLVGLVSCVIQCGVSKTPLEIQAPQPPSSEMTPAQYYAGEILAYLMQVVVGREGPVGMRSAWSQRAFGHPLDLAHITRVMNDATQDKSKLLVFDPNIIGLSRVMFYYNRTLNQFKGRYIFDSLYPSPELVALRLLLVDKLQQGQQVHLQDLAEKHAMRGETAKTSANTPAQSTTLQPEEMQLMRDVIEAAPIFDAYLRHPHIVRALQQMGAVVDDAYVQARAEQAHYRQFPCTFKTDQGRSKPVLIAILPSFNEEFEYGSAANATSLNGFNATQTYRTAVAGFERQLRHALEAEMKQSVPASAKPVAPSGVQAAAAQSETQNADVAFLPYLQRPLVIYPANADQVVQEVCPEADFVIIVLGRDVYLSLNIDPVRDVYPAVNRIYLDIKDLIYAQFDQEVELVSRWVAAQLHRPKAP